MISFSYEDILIVLGFIAILLLTGFAAGRKAGVDADDFLLSGRKVGLTLFVLTNVSTWYGGILGVGEFTYTYGLLAWFTQGLPYYIFAAVFALLFAKKIRNASLFTIPDKITDAYGKRAGSIAAVLVFLLVSPAPYLLMTANLLTLIFEFSIVTSLIISLFISSAYLLKGGYRSDLYTDVVQFFVMFAGFIIIFIAAYNNLGGFDYLSSNLPDDHLKFTGGASPVFIIVWFLIAMWTFADPGFHQRCYAAGSGSIAVKGILISILFWAAFDFLTTTTGLYARAAIPDLQTPVLSFPLLAEIVLSPGLKGLFYAGLFATILSTFNSFMFLSATTIGRDFIFAMKKNPVNSSLKKYTRTGLILSAIVSFVLGLYIPSVIELWYTIGSICIPAIIFPVISAYFPAVSVTRRFILTEMITAFSVSLMWYFIRENFSGSFVYEIEPMLAGLTAAFVLHLTGVIKKRLSSF